MPGLFRPSEFWIRKPGSESDSDRLGLSAPAYLLLVAATIAGSWVLARLPSLAHASWPAGLLLGWNGLFFLRQWLPARRKPLDMALPLFVVAATLVGGVAFPPTGSLDRTPWNEDQWIYYFGATPSGILSLWLLPTAVVLFIATPFAVRLMHGPRTAVEPPADADELRLPAPEMWSGLLRTLGIVAAATALLLCAQPFATFLLELPAEWLDHVRHGGSGSVAAGAFDILACSMILAAFFVGTRSNRRWLRLSLIACWAVALCAIGSTVSYLLFGAGFQTLSSRADEFFFWLGMGAIVSEGIRFQR